MRPAIEHTPKIPRDPIPEWQLSQQPVLTNPDMWRANKYAWNQASTRGRYRSWQEVGAAHIPGWPLPGPRGGVGSLTNRS